MSTQASDVAALAHAGAPLHVQRAAVDAYLADRGVREETRRAVASHSRAGVMLRHADRPTRTCLGGPGILPAGEEWPHGRSGHPMTFFAAFDFAELPALEPLPSEGVLLLYWDEEFPDYEMFDYHPATRVYYAPDHSGLVEHDAPAENWGAFGRIYLHGVLSPISGESSKVVAAAGEDREQLIDAMNGLSESLGRFHQVLGSSRDVQGPVLDGMSWLLGEAFPETRARFSEQELAGEGWTLLAQINEDEGYGIGDAGALYFVMPEVDLYARRFDRVIGDMECH